MILTGHQIRELGIVTPHRAAYEANGLSGGEDIAGYNIALANAVFVPPVFSRLSVSVEGFRMPLDVAGEMVNKSTLARFGVDAAGCTDLEPGWIGDGLTLELRYHPRPRYWRGLRWNGIRILPGFVGIILPAGTPIAKVRFMLTNQPTEGYRGKYQGQPAVPTEPMASRAAAPVASAAQRERRRAF